PTPENDSDSLPAAVRRVGIGDDTAKALVRGLIVKHHASLYGDLAATQVTRGGSRGDRQVVAEPHCQLVHLLRYGASLPWAEVGGGSLVILLDILLTRGHVTGVGISQADDDHTRHPHRPERRQHCVA